VIPSTRLRPPTALVTMLVAGMGLFAAFEPASVFAQGQDSGGKKITLSKDIGAASPQTLQAHWKNEAINPQPLPPKVDLTGARAIEVNSFGMPVQSPTETGTPGRGTGGKAATGGIPVITKDSVSLSKEIGAASPQTLQAHWTGETLTPAQGTGTASGGIPNVTGVSLAPGVLTPLDTGSKKPKGKSP
jgi:hypothetical protein